MAGGSLLGQKLGPYRVEHTIGSGATGVVYRAIPDDGSAPVALKVLHEKLGTISALEKRFAREARVLKKLSHPNIVDILDFGTSEGRTYIAIELLEGRTLEEELGDDPIDPLRALTIYQPILEALAEAHEHDVVHRDLKPANVFMLDGGEVKLLDFGLAKMLSVDAEETEDGTLTRKGRIVGTPAYMAPEQITGVFIDVRADIYALGVMLYELLADRRPFHYERRSELLRAHLLEPVPIITKVREGLEVDAALMEILHRSLAKDAAKRYPNAKAMLEAVRALPQDAVRFNAQVTRTVERARTGPTSAVISSGERRAITTAFSTEASSVQVDEAQLRGEPTDPPTSLTTLRAPASTATRAKGLSTAALVAIAVVLLLAAAALFVLGR